MSLVRTRIGAYTTAQCRAGSSRTLAAAPFVQTRGIKARALAKRQDARLKQREQYPLPCRSLYIHTLLRKLGEKGASGNPNEESQKKKVKSGAGVRILLSLGC